LITSGPTQEAIDPVRFIGNHSSGKMGNALAAKFREAGATVTVVTGPVNAYPKDVNLVKVYSAAQMLEKAQEHHQESDIVVFAAAVADYRPLHPASQKIKKKSGEDELEIKLTKNPDIAATLGESKQHQFHVGFALETENEAANAQQKLKKKNFDLIVLNSLNDNGAGFKGDTNKVTFFDAHNKPKEFELKDKMEVASDIVAHVIHQL